MQYFIAQQNTTNPVVLKPTNNNYLPGLFTGIAITLVGVGLTHLLTKLRTSTTKLEEKADQGDQATLENTILKAILDSESRIKSEFKTDLGLAKSEFKEDLGSLRTELKSDMKDLKDHIDKRFDKHDTIRERVAVLESKVS